MVYRCIVFGCKSGYDSAESELKSKNGKTPSFFSPPKGMLEEWRRRIPIPPDRIHSESRVCENHFEDHFIIRETVLNLPDGSVYKEVHRAPRLAHNAVPTRFSNTQPVNSKVRVPAYCDIKLPKPRRDPSLRNRPKVAEKRKPQEQPTLPPKKLKTDEPAQVIPLLRENLSKLLGRKEETLTAERDAQENIPDTNLGETIEGNKSSPIKTEEKLADIMRDNPQNISLPHSLWTFMKNDESVIFLQLSNIAKIPSPIPNFVVSKQVVVPFITPEATPLVFVNGKKTEKTKIINKKSELEEYLKEIDDLSVCPGTGLEMGADNYSRSMHCSGFCPSLPSGKEGKRCKACAGKRHSTKKSERRQQKKEATKRMKTRKLQRQKKSLIAKVKKLQHKLEEIMKKYDNINESQIENIVKNLPPRQQEAVKACISAAKAKKPCGRRYTQQWIYECTLMRIKSPCLYRKMIRDQTLALPSLRQLQRYMKKLKPAYGFIDATFELLTKKSSEMKEDERHGVLLFDEISLTKALSFNKSSLKIDGFVNLGNYTPEEQRDQPGDHALVFMFKPWKGQWFQTVAAFLSKGAVKGPTLAKLGVEATALLEKSGLHVDMWVCDGAPWNRAMWTELGLKNPFTAKRKRKKVSEKTHEKEEAKVSFQHPCDASRKIYMCSDFPHLIKSLKARILPNEKGKARDLLTPDGVVKFSHWQALYEADSARDKPIQVCHKLTKDHLYPHNYQTMNVKMAFSFFSKQVADAMEHYRDEGVAGLADCAPTVAFIRRVNDLVDAMNANTPWGSIRKKDESETEKSARYIIDQFIQYLMTWSRMPGKQADKLAHQTQYGLYVTLNSALQVSEYLINQFGFEYVMTRRMNQDALEHFFGEVRQACGCNSHPDPVQFIQVYRLLSVASLVKPPRGSNITGGDMLNALLNSSDIMSDAEKQRHVEFEKELDDLLDNGEPVESIFALFDHAYTEKNKIDEKALRMFCGYVARKARRATVAKACDECFHLLQAPEGSENELDSLIDRRSNGHLLKPSDGLYKIIYSLEDAICHTIQHTQLHENLLFEVVENAKQSTYTPVGCAEHSRELTKSIARFYLNTRMIFTCKQFNRTKIEDNDKRKRMKDAIKMFKIVPM